ncbi:hypothetical protein SK128_026190, partial [Halocaridina rubra]
MIPAPPLNKNDEVGVFALPSGHVPLTEHVCHFLFKGRFGHHTHATALKEDIMNRQRDI